RNSSLIPVHSMNIISFNLFHGPHPLTRLRLLDPDTDRRLVPEPLTLGFFESGGLSDCRPVISS
ncbi:MAG: hypothetical protein LBK42_06510, partial [Propionibacteriaceae bacterium]|nr:hypothetical protein [Propionibacteriaceae bacterium]